MPGRSRRATASPQGGAAPIACREYGASDVEAARRVIENYRDLRIGLADASIVALSHLHRVVDLLSLDECHFRVLCGHRDRPFRILPADG